MFNIYNDLYWNKGKKTTQENILKVFSSLGANVCLFSTGEEDFLVVMCERGGTTESYTFLQKLSIMCPLSATHVLAYMCMFYTVFSWVSVATAFWNGLPHAKQMRTVWLILLTSCYWNLAFLSSPGDGFWPVSHGWERQQHLQTGRQEENQP